MSLARLLRQPVTVQPCVAGALDYDGNPTDKWSAGITYNGYFEQRVAQEVTVDGDTAQRRVAGTAP